MSERIALELEPVDTLRLANLCGQFDEHLKQIEARLDVEILCRGNLFTIRGSERTARAARRLLQSLYRLSATEVLSPDVINLHLQESGIRELANEVGVADDEFTVKTKRGVIRGRGPNQKSYLREISRNAINFGVGPAGTGKTYLAVACAVAALQSDVAGHHRIGRCRLRTHQQAQAPEHRGSGHQGPDDERRESCQHARIMIERFRKLWPCRVGAVQR